MKIDGATLSNFIVMSISVLGALFALLSGHSKARAAELRRLRKSDQLKDRYIYRLEQGYTTLDRELPPKPKGYDEAVSGGDDDE